MKPFSVHGPSKEKATEGETTTAGQETRDATSDSYWESRGKASFSFQDEVFYTITPIGFYFHRRKELLARMERLLQRLPAGASVLDFGCGDGFFTCRFAEQFPDLRYWGCDLSHEMIARAHRLQQEQRIQVTFQQAASDIPFDETFDLIYVIGVFYNLDETTLEQVARRLTERLKPGGQLVLFEVTSLLFPRSGKSWSRRRPQAYRRLFRQAGLTLLEEELISFPLYNVFGRFLFPGIGHLFFAGDMQRANNTGWYQRLSNSFITATRPIDRHLPSWAGNTLFVFQRRP
jgi:SAM-dependent methyltransferase